MKKLILLIIVLYHCSMVNIVFAQNNRLSIGGTLIKNNQSFNNAKGIQLKFHHQLNNRFCIDLTVGSLKDRSTLTIVSPFKRSLSLQEIESNDGLFAGDFNMIWIELSPTYYIYNHPKSHFHIYTGAGFGLYFPDHNWTWSTYEMLSESATNENFLYYESNFNNKLGVIVRTGIDIPITQNSVINLEYKYMIYNTNLKYIIETVDENGVHNWSNKKRSLNFNSSVLQLSISISI